MQELESCYAPQNKQAKMLTSEGLYKRPEAC
jgi:hypothetical protein